MELVFKAVSLFFGAADGLLYGLIGVVALDYITGVCVAIHQKQLSSNIGAKGIAKKVAIFALISVSHILDAYVLDSGDALRVVTTTFYIVNECVSILENTNKLGLPFPDKLSKILSTLKKSSDNK